MSGRKRGPWKCRLDFQKALVNECNLREPEVDVRQGFDLVCCRFFNGVFPASETSQSQIHY